MRKIFVNLKDWLNLEQNIEFANSRIQENIVVFPSLPYIHLYSNKDNIELGTQSTLINFEDECKCGHISLKHLKEFKIKWILLNHRDMPITNIKYLEKLVSACKVEKIKMIFCINYNIKREINFIIKALNKNKIFENIYIAYEPIEDISFDQVQKNIDIINNEIYKKTKHALPLLFGGNVNHNNIDMYKKLEISGYLISRGALKIKNIDKLIDLLRK